MAGQLLLVNPRRRRSRRKSAGRKRRGPRRMSALQRKYFGKRRRNPARRRRVHHVARRVRRRSRRHVMSNPVRRYRRRARVAARHHRRRRRNPIGMGSIMGPAMTAVYGTVGALATDVLFGVLPIPAQFKSGGMGTLAKAAVTIAGGMLASKVVGRSAAEKGVAGALTVQLYSFVKPLIAAAAPNIPGLGYYGAGYSLSDMGEYISNIPTSLSGLGRFVPNSLMGDDDDTRNYAADDLSMYVPMR